MEAEGNGNWLRGGGGGRLGKLLAVGAILVVIVWLYRDSVRGWIIARGVLANDAPSAELLAGFVRDAKDRGAAILALWNTGKIVHRNYAVRQLAETIEPGVGLSTELEGILVAGALDADVSVREAALVGLRRMEHPAATVLAARQLADRDPQVRLLGLDHLRIAEAGQGIPLAASRLDDEELRVAARAAKLLERWSGEDFGVQLSDTVAVDNSATGQKEMREEGVAKTRAAVERAMAWWTVHRGEYPGEETEVSLGVNGRTEPRPAADFQLPALEGGSVRLSDFRGKVVVLNFWTTWCGACLGEIPALVELQRRHGERVVVLGVSLDSVPDSHDHLGGHDSADEGESGSESEGAVVREASREEIRSKVGRIVKRFGINYPVLLDERNEVGSRFNGGELPTTAIIDPAGHLRRRFVGGRSLSVFEALVVEALETGERR